MARVTDMCSVNKSIYKYVCQSNVLCNGFYELFSYINIHVCDTMYGNRLIVWRVQHDNSFLVKLDLSIKYKVRVMWC